MEKPSPVEKAFFVRPDGADSDPILVGTSRLPIIVNLVAQQFAPIMEPKGFEDDATYKGRSALALGMSMSSAIEAGADPVEVARAFRIGEMLGRNYKGEYEIKPVTE